VAGRGKAQFPDKNRDSALSVHTAQPIKDGVRFDQLKETQSYKNLVFVGSNQKFSN
jgi:hypothetical protein